MNVPHGVYDRKADGGLGNGAINPMPPSRFRFGRRIPIGVEDTRVEECRHGRGDHGKERAEEIVIQEAARDDGVETDDEGADTGAHHPQIDAFRKPMCQQGADAAPRGMASERDRGGFGGIDGALVRLREAERRGFCAGQIDGGAGEHTNDQRGGIGTAQDDGSLLCGQRREEKSPIQIGDPLCGGAQQGDAERLRAKQQRTAPQKKRDGGGGNAADGLTDQQGIGTPHEAVPDKTAGRRYHLVCGLSEWVIGGDALGTGVFFEHIGELLCREMRMLIVPHTQGGFPSKCAGEGGFVLSKVGIADGKNKKEKKCGNMA